MTCFNERSPSGLDRILERIVEDPYARFLGIEILELCEGCSKTAITIGEHLLNFLGMPHGGVIFSLADVAFSAACNSYGQTAVALNMNVSFLAAVPAETRLYAVATEESRSRRIALYRVAVSAEDGTLVALCHGTAYCKNQPPVAEGR